VPLRFTLRQLEYLVAVGESGSIALAAERLNVSSPSISTAIAQLEAEFGMPVFVRKRAHGMSPTQSGRELIREAAEVLRTAGRLSDLANDFTQKIRGTLNVGCLLTFAQIVLPRLRRGFVARHADVAISQFELHQAAIIDGLREARLDVALTYDLAIPADLEFVEVAVLPPFALLPDAHPLVGRLNVSVAELAEFPMVLLDLPLSSDYFLSFFAAAHVRPRIVERTRDLAVMQSLVGNDFGYSIANLKPVSNRSPDGRALHFIPISGPVEPMRLGLLSAAGGRSSPAIRAFVDYCREVLPDQIVPDLVVGPAAPQGEA
jgi:DNA-binding transcriptional LysR family regulator